MMRKGDVWGWGVGVGLAQQCSRLIRDVCGRQVAGPVHDDDDKPVGRWAAAGSPKTGWSKNFPCAPQRGPLVSVPNRHRI